MHLRTALFCVLLALGTAAAFAGTTGKIAGVVKDAQTGEPLVGASVLLQGTSQGAATNVDGYYVILNVQPGKYTIVSSAVGYNKKTIENVRVSIDLTTAIDIMLAPSVVEQEEVVVQATRPMVQRDETAKTAVVSGDQIQALPVTEVAQVLQLQAGFVAGSLRGGRSGEVAYWIDGVPVTDAFNGTQVVEVNKDLVQELQLVSGAFNAEYGQAMSGIVNIATKEGSSQFTGGVGTYVGGYLPDDKTLFPGNDKFRPFSIRDYEANLSGPVTGENLTFFANGRYIYFDGYLQGFNRFNPWNVSYTDSLGAFHLNRDPSGRGDSARVSLSNSERWYGQGKLTWHASSAIKLTGNFIYDWTKSKPYNRSFFYDPNGLGNDYNMSNTGIFQWTHLLSQNTFYTVGASVFVRKYQHYLYKDPGNPGYVHSQLFQTPDSWSFLTGGTDLNQTWRTTTTWLAKVDLSSQVTSEHLVKVGAEFRQHKIRYDSYTLQPVAEQSTFNPLTSSPFIKTIVPDLSSIYHDYYLRKPVELAAYMQDKMEFKDFIVNFGIRFDYFQPDGKILADPSDPNIYAPLKTSNQFFDNNGDGIQQANEPSKTVADREAYWYKKASAKWQISPRIGFSFPITARGIVHFSYGHFFQVPHFELMYQNPFFKVGPGTSGVVGNADLQPEQTINGEIGVQQQLTDDIAVDVTAYLRDIRNLTGTRSDLISTFGGALQYSRLTNSDFGFVKGIVVTLEKQFSAGFHAKMDYTYQIAKGTASDPNEARNATVGGRQPEVQLTPLGWDQRHTLNVALSYSASRWGASLIGQYGSGTPYTPRATTDITSLLTNSQLKPAFLNVDVRGYYEIPVDPFRIVAFVRVFNLFDLRNETNVFDDTGRAGFTGDEAIARASNPHQYVNTLDQWFRIATNYSEPRRIEFGMNLEF